MGSMSNLIPTPIVDKNGKQTTVRKRVDTLQKKALNAPAPSVAASAPVSVPISTPLPEIQPLSDEEREVFANWQSMLMNNGHFREEIREIAKKPLPSSVEALAWRLTREGDAQETAVRFLTTYHTRRSSQFAKTFRHEQEFLFNTLRNSLLLVDRISKDETGSPALKIGGPITYANMIDKSLNGYRYSPKMDEVPDLTPIMTEEELSSITAVTRFILDARDRKDYGSCREKEYKDSIGKKLTGIYMANRSLDAFLRENPHEIDRVLKYVQERRIGNTVKDTKALVKYLRESKEMGALDDGWL